jgi:hypothetical protein
MKKILIILLFNFLLIYISVSQSNNRKYDLWRIPSFFRGYNILDWKPKTLKDFLDLKASGATLAQLACDGFNNALPPYDTNQKSMAETEMMVEYCRQAGLYYTIAVRKGPGREDVYYEGQGIVPKSTIWTDNYEQALYGKMLKDIVHRYKDDSLFVGLGLIVEPNPLFDSVYLNSAMLKPMLANNNINITAIMKQLIDSVRTEDPKIPVLVQNVAYSCPEFYDLMERQTDSYVVYEFHSWRPSEYVNDTTTNDPNKTYPGNYFSINDFAFKNYNKNFLDSATFKAVRDFQKETGSPIFLGEFGLLKPQKDGVSFFQDISDIALEHGWHFALWVWRERSSPNSYNYEKYNTDYMNEIKQMFAKNINSTYEVKTQETGIYLYPEIAQNYILINVNNKSDGILFIYNVLGIENSELRKEIPYKEYDTAHSSIKLNISYLSNGIYFAYFFSKSERYVKSFIIQK